MNQSAGTLGQEAVSFDYHTEESNGTLSIYSDASKTSIRDEDIVAVLENNRPSETLTRTPGGHYILRVLKPEDSNLSRKATLELLQVSNLPPSFLEAHPRSRCPLHLQTPWYHDKTPNLHIIISTGSGISEARLFFDDILKEVLLTLGINDDSYMLHTTESEKSISDLTRSVFLPRSNEGVAQTILLISGDGGVADILNELLLYSRKDAYVKPVIGLLPLGTGNALANSTGLNRGSTRGLRSLLTGKPYSLPTFAATFSPGSELLIDEGRIAEVLPTLEKGFGVVYGAVVCSWAFHASLVADSDTLEYRKYGNQRFQMAAQELLTPSDGSAPHVYKGKLTLLKRDNDGHETSSTLDRREHMYVLASLVSNLEEMLKISPHSKPLDGQLRLVHFGAVSSAEVMRIMQLAYQGGRHIDNEAVCYDDIDGLRIDFEEENDRWRRVCVDGKIVRVNQGGWVEIRKEVRDVIDIVADL